MEQKKMKFPKDWYYLQDTEIKKYIKHLLRNYKNYELKCTPYDRDNNTGLVVTITDPKDPENCNVHIEKCLSETYRRGGRATQGWVVFSAGDYGYSYDGYRINGKSVFIDQNNALWPERYPNKYPLCDDIHKLYMAVRAETIPTYKQEEQVAQHKADQAKVKKAQRALLNQMFKDGNISTTVFNLYKAKISQNVK